MLHLTPDMLESAYELLRLTPPFRGWKLPDPDTLEFRVTAVRDRYGHFNDKDGKGWPNITISSHHVKSLDSLIEVMAHEMVHVRQFQKLSGDIHGPEFKRLAALVCRRHGFDPKTF